MKTTRVASLAGALGALVFFLNVVPAHANPVTLVATIYGVYDAESGIGDLPSGVTAGLTPVNSQGVYDTPSLFFVNPTAYNITNVQLVLTGYGTGTYNSGATQTLSIGTMNAGSVTQLAWGGSCAAGVLFCDDYDDEYSNNFGANPKGAPTLASFPGPVNGAGGATDCTLNNSVPGWFQFCSPVGNFKVVMTGMWNGHPVYSVFNEVDVNGVYIGWEGVDPDGWSENANYDVHSGTVNGVLANIYIGTPPADTPEPGTIVLLLTGAVGLFAFARRYTV